MLKTYSAIALGWTEIVAELLLLCEIPSKENIFYHNYPQEKKYFKIAYLITEYWEHTTVKSYQSSKLSKEWSERLSQHIPCLHTDRRKLEN